MKYSIILFFCCQLVNTSCLAQAPKDPSPKDVQQVFPATKLPPNYKFHFTTTFEEITITTKDRIHLNALLFKADSSKGVVLYLHGNTGGLDSWGKLSKIYTSLHYDLLMLDYRGYGKSEGHIKNEAQVFSDVQTAYTYLKTRYKEDKIIVLGYSIGTCPAAYLAANNHPKQLILQAPCYTLADAVHQLYPTLDTMDIPFHFNTYQFVKKTVAPIIIIHGDADQVFYYGSSKKLALFLKPADELVTLKGAGHLDMAKNIDYLKTLKRIVQ
jgi:uncharacterized protein